MTYYNITWGKALLRSLGAPYNIETDAFLRAWAQAENTDARWNPFATTQPAIGATDFNYVGVKNFLTWNQGVVTTKKTLVNGRYDPLVSAIVKGLSRHDMAVALKNSPWGTGALVQGILISASGPKQFPVGYCYPGAKTVWSRNIRPSDTGQDVDELLRVLSGNKASFYNTIVSHGNWVQAVKNHQRLRPWLWPADGIVGPKTYRSITGHD